MKILILTTSDRPRVYTEGLKKNLKEDLNAQVDIENLEDIVFEVIDNTVAINSQKLNILEYNFIYIKHWHLFEEGAMVINLHTKVKVIPSETRNIVSKTKFGETFQLAMINLPVPDSIYSHQNKWYLNNFSYLSEKLGLPFIFKSSSGKKGSENYLISSDDQLNKAISGTESNFIAQSYIDNDGDYRIINFGEKAEMVIKRTRQGETHLNNTSAGGQGSLLSSDEIADEVISDSLEAAIYLGREISGIDVVIDKNTGKHYIMEVNYSPQITTGTYTKEKRTSLSKYISDLSSLN